VNALQGRTHELERLAKAADDARAGRGGTVLVCGEPGIGKTRLAEEVARHARPQGTRVVWGRAWEGGGAPPFWPWIQIARALLKVGADPPAELGRLSPDLGASGGPSPLLATSADRFVLFDSMLRFVRDAAGREPLLLVFDDLHAADVGTVQMLGFLAPELRDERVLVVGTFRDVEARLQPPIGDALAAVGRAGEVLRLPRLGRAAVAAIAREHVALDDVDVDVLFAKTEGNPLFVRETARVLATEGRADDGTLPLSDGVRAAIRAHLGRVSPERRRDLEVAAVIGREFAATALAPIVDVPVSELVGRLSEAAAAGFLIETMPSRFAFVHGLFREVLLADLGARAAPIHASIAERLEALHAGDPTALAEIARHWLDAGPDHAARACEAARHAAEGAISALAYSEAADLFERALSAHEQASPGDARGRAEAQLAIGDARIRAGETRAGRTPASARRRSRGASATRRCSCVRPWATAGTSLPAPATASSRRCWRRRWWWWALVRTCARASSRGLPQRSSRLATRAGPSDWLARRSRS
jgi:predicted ATPase